MKLNDKKMIIGFTIFPSRASLRCKVENILKRSLDSIPSPSPSEKIQSVGGKGVKAKQCWVLSTNF